MLLSDNGGQAHINIYTTTNLLTETQQYKSLADYVPNLQLVLQIIEGRLTRLNINNNSQIVPWMHTDDSGGKNLELFIKYKVYV